MQADPVGYHADTNLYRYCSNNPINLIDPQGTEDEKPKPPEKHYLGSTTDLISRILKSQKVEFSKWVVSNKAIIAPLGKASVMWAREMTIKKFYELTYQVTHYWLYIYSNGYTEIVTESGGTYTETEVETERSTEYLRTEGGCLWNAARSWWEAYAPNPNPGEGMYVWIQD